AGLVEGSDLFGAQIPASGPKILPQLFLVARSDNDRGHRGALQQPVQRDLGNSVPGLLRHRIQRVDHRVQMFVSNLRPVVSGFVKAAFFGKRLAAAQLTGEAAPSERAPNERTNSLIEAER